MSSTVKVQNISVFVTMRGNVTSLSSMELMKNSNLLSNASSKALLCVSLSDTIRFHWLFNEVQFIPPSSLFSKPLSTNFKVMCIPKRKFPWSKRRCTNATFFWNFYVCHAEDVWTWLSSYKWGPQRGNNPSMGITLKDVTDSHILNLDKYDLLVGIWFILYTEHKRCEDTT